MSDTDEIPNLDLPIANVILEAIVDLTGHQQKELLGSMTIAEFVSHRVDIYLKELEVAMHNGFDELGAKEIALKESLAGISEDDG
jgi:hypothetical protein